MFILQIKRRDVETHLQTAMRPHLDLACVKLSDTQDQLNQTQVQLRNLQKKFEDTTRELEKKFNDLEKKIEYSEEKCDSFKWRIDSFSDVLRKSKRGVMTFVDSCPFYRWGYKCKLRINPNGFGVGQHTHLSLYLRIMKGEYDAILTWPFHKKVIFTLVDQHEKANDRENIVKFFSQQLEPLYSARPVQGENAGWGFSKFVSHEKLQERRYIVDDTIFIQVFITSPE